MIPIVGIMIGFYIITRMIELKIETRNEETERFSTATIVVSVIGILILFVTGFIPS
jgi:hypothetical protein